jgi:hypothetical protein
LAQPRIKRLEFCDSAHWNAHMVCPADYAGRRYPMTRHASKDGAACVTGNGGR